jgi:class 3 adenylate cyclase
MAFQRRLETALSRAAGRFVRYVHSGRTSALAAGFHLPAASHAFDVELALDEIATAADVSQTIAALEPRPRPYLLLKHALMQAVARSRQESRHAAVRLARLRAHARFGLAEQQEKRANHN